MNDIQVTNLRQKAIKGLAWTSVGQVTAQIVRYLFMLILAWFLLPEDFGLLGLGFIVIDTLKQVGEFGIASALIQRKDLDGKTINTAFWANLSANMLIGLLTVSFAPAIAQFMHEPQLKTVLYGLMILFPIQALLLIPRTMLTRELRLDQLAKADVIGEISFGITGIITALLEGAVWSLIIASIVRQFVRSIILTIAYPWRPRFQFDKQSFQELIQFGFPVMGSALFSVSIAKLDYFVIGRYFGAEILGYYTLAFQLAVLPTWYLANILNRVAFPSFSKLQDNIQQLKRNFLQMLEYFMILLTPYTLGWILFADLVIEIFYPDNWLPTASAIRILTIAGLMYSFDTVVNIFYAVGRSDLRLKMLIFRLCLLVLFLFIYGLSHGMEGVAWSVSLAAIFSAPLNLYYFNKLTGANWSESLKKIYLSFLLAILASGITILAQQNILVKHSLVNLIALILLFGFIYLLPLTFIYHQQIQTNLSLLLQRYHQIRRA
ncbi:MAG: lipopolysaccharide biosynthesis protein [Ardenticatenaceae bacterium]|nr:lipopolysaccharide biosynthesis protein [Ardenticatenaceae bacterium]MCB9005496.1 lipopolysaccharide biosynthesis protein [Ardenticatenaceae bacterium]